MIRWSRARFQVWIRNSRSNNSDFLTARVSSFQRSCFPGITNRMRTTKDFTIASAFCELWKYLPLSTEQSYILSTCVQPEYKLIQTCPMLSVYNFRLARLINVSTISIASRACISERLRRNYNSLCPISAHSSKSSRVWKVICIHPRLAFFQAGGIN